MSLLPPSEQGGLTWRRSARSQGFGMCVEVAAHPEGVALRHSKLSDHDAYLFTLGEFKAFVDGIKRGEFDDLL